MNNPSIGSWIRTFRNQAGIGLNEMAKELSVSSGYLSNLETGKTDNISVEVLIKAVNVLRSPTCPFCGHATHEATVRGEVELRHRVDRIYQLMLNSISENQERLILQLDLLDYGLGRHH